MYVIERILIAVLLVLVSLVLIAATAISITQQPMVRARTVHMGHPQ